MLGKVNLLPVDIAVVAHKQTSKCGKKNKVRFMLFCHTNPFCSVQVHNNLLDLPSGSQLRDENYNCCGCEPKMHNKGFKLIVRRLPGKDAI